MQQVKLLTPEQQLDRLRRLQYKFEIELQTPGYKFKSIIEENPSLIYVDFKEFSDVINFIKNECFLTNDAAITICKKLKPEHFNMNLISKKQEELYDLLKLGKTSFGRGLSRSYRILDMTREEIESWINCMKDNFQVDDRFLATAFTDCVYFGVSDPYFLHYFKQKRDFFNMLGIETAKYNNEPQIFNFTLTKLNYKLKLALLNGLSINDFIDKKYLTSPEKIYARFIAKQNGEFPLNTVYLSEKDVRLHTGKSSNDFVEQYPFDDEAMKNINAEFMERFPDLNERISQFFIDAQNSYQENIYAKPSNTQLENKETTIKIKDQETSSKTIEDNNICQKQKQIESHETTKTQTSRIKRLLGALNLDDFSLNILKHGLDIEEFNKENTPLVVANFLTLEDFGFSKSEILARPSALLLEPQKLTLRAKLAIINNCSKRQFLNETYTHSEETIYARTKGAEFIGKIQHPDIYSPTDKQFFNVFGIKTTKLKQLFPLSNEIAVNDIDKMFQKTLKTNANSIQDSENEQ